MQFRIIAAAIASMAITSVLAGPLAASEPLAARADQAALEKAINLGASTAEANKQIFDTYSEALQAAYQKNYVEAGRKPPTIEQIKELQKRIEDHAEKTIGKRDANALLGLGVDIGVGGLNLGVGLGIYDGWQCAPGNSFYQCGNIFNYNPALYCSTFGTGFPTCGGYFC